MSAWAEGAGTADDAVPPSIFIVGDRKQSIYGFRDAEVAVLEEAARHIDALRPDLPARAAITRSHRAVLPLLHFVNDVFDAVDKQPLRADAFRYSDDDRFPLATDAGTARDAVGLVAARTDAEQAEAVAEEIARLLDARVTVRDRMTGARRTHRARRHRRAVPHARGPSPARTGAGEAPRPVLRLQGARLLRRRRDQGRARAARVPRRSLLEPARRRAAALAPRAGVGRGTEAAGAGSGRCAGPGRAGVSGAARARRTWPVCRRRARSLAGWLPLVDRLPPAELLDRVLAEAAYTRGAGRARAGAGPREPQEDPRPRPPHPESRLRDARAAGRSTSRSSSPAATSRTRSSTPSTP